MRYANDGHQITSHIQRPETCEVCGDDLWAGTWWVTTYPLGVHTVCRDWSVEPFPLRRHLMVTSKLARRIDITGEAEACLVAAQRWLRRRERSWPRGGSDVVVESYGVMRRLRTRLSLLGVGQKLLNQI